MTRALYFAFAVAFVWPMAALPSARPRAQAAAASGAPAPAGAPDAVPRLTYSKSFAGSTPAFFQITVRRDGDAEYESIEKNGQPAQSLAFTVAPAMTRRLFALAAAVDDFARPLEAKAKVSYMGTKMLAYDDAARHQEQTFNYTTASPAAALTDLFERIGTTGEDALRLRHAARYDHLGVLQVLDGILRDARQNELGAPQLLRPTLEKVASDPQLMDVAHVRAREVLTTLAREPKS